MPGFVATPRDDLCLDFANTLFWRGSDPPTEELHGPRDLLAWAATSGGADPALVERLGEAWQGAQEKGARAFAEAIELREMLWRTISAVAEGAAPAREDVGALNKALASAPARRELEAAGEGFAWTLGAEGATVALLLAPVLWSAGDLLVGPRRSRVRRCGNERCLFLFLDDSKSGNRRWCSMQSCGNRAKAHRHYLRRRAAADSAS